MCRTFERFFLNLVKLRSQSSKEVNPFSEKILQLMLKKFSNAGKSTSSYLSKMPAMSEHFKSYVLVLMMHLKK